MWPAEQVFPTHHWLCTLPESTPLARLAYLAKLRWRVERDYQETKSDVGRNRFEGLAWNGLYHHLALCSRPHGFLVPKRAHDQRTQTPASGGPKREPLPSTQNNAHG